MIHPDNPDAARFEAAAAALYADPESDGIAAADATGFLHYLEYDDGDAAAAPGRGRMLRAAAMLRRLFLLPVPDAPGLVFLGAEADPAIVDAALHGMPVGSMAGSGLAPQRAFEACVGEAIEYISQFVRPGDRIEQHTASQASMPQDPATRSFITALLDSCGVGADQAIGWIPVRATATGQESWLPADLCLRRPPGQRDFVAPLKLSTGCAAGVTRDAAALRAVLELIERDAAALWWRGGRRGRAVPPESDAGRVAAELLTQLRQGNADRRTWLLDITTELGVPVVAALSCGGDGYGFAFGLGCRVSQPEAARAAIFELCQVELGPHVVAAKRQESGDDALQEGDLRHLRRATLIDARSCPLLQPVDVAGAGTAETPADPTDAWKFVVQRLSAHGITTFSLELQRADFAVPVVRILAPGLQLEPCRIVGERLALAVQETGGGAPHTNGLSLL